MAAIGIKATTLTPHHYHSLAVPSGTATLPEYLSDRAVAFSIGNALGCLAPFPALPKKDYREHLACLPCLASLFETKAPSLLPPLAKRLNIDAESGLTKSILDATGSGNLKTYFFIQEIPAGLVYEGAVFGKDPFLLAAEAYGRAVHEIIVRMGRHLGGLIKLERTDIEEVRLNVHTGLTFGIDITKTPRANGEKILMERYALHDLQASSFLPLNEAERLVTDWRTSNANA